MSIYVVLGLLVLLYIVPELLRPKRQQYEYPELPDLETTRTPPPFTYEGEGVSMEHSRFADTGKADGRAKSLKLQSTMPEEIAVPLVVADVDPWVGHLSSHDITNGVIFAEILQPPRSKRPLQCWRKR
jgi:hypothetical protein